SGRPAGTIRPTARAGRRGPGRTSGLPARGPHQPAPVSQPAPRGAALLAGCRTDRHALRARRRPAGGNRPPLPGPSSTRPVDPVPGRGSPRLPDGCTGRGTRPAARAGGRAMSVPFWVAELANEFWEAAELREPFPRSLHVPIARALTMSVTALPRLSLGGV